MRTFRRHVYPKLYRIGENRTCAGIATLAVDLGRMAEDSRGHRPYLGCKCILKATMALAHPRHEELIRIVCAGRVIRSLQNKATMFGLVWKNHLVQFIAIICRRIGHAIPSCMNEFHRHCHRSLISARAIERLGC